MTRGAVARLPAAACGQCLALFLSCFAALAEAGEPLDLPVPQLPSAPPEQEAPGSFWERGHLLGDYGGARSQLEDRGIAVELIYTGEAFANLRGGINTSDAREYNGLLEAAVSADTERLGWWDGGLFLFLAQNHHGDGLTEEHVGDIQVISNIEADHFTQVSEYWYEHAFADAAMRLKLGKQDANSDFAAADYGAAFINSSFGFPPNIPLPTYPDPGLGAAVFAEPFEWLAAGAGLFDGDANGGTSGFDTAFDGEGGSFSIFELALRPGGGQRGRYSAGVWHHSANVAEISAAPAPGAFSSNYGVYAIADQPLWREDERQAQGFGAFLQISWTPDDRNELGLYYGGGLIYTGLLSGRDEDAAGIGVASARLGGEFRDVSGGTHETAVELFYRMQWFPWLALQPDVQYIVNPGGAGRNALAAGLRFEAAF